jgi:hypothetical protein
MSPGSTYGSLNSTSKGDKDVFIRKFNFAGQKQWTRQFGTEPEDYGRGVAVYRGTSSMHFHTTNSANRPLIVLGELSRTRSVAASDPARLP